MKLGIGGPSASTPVAYLTVERELVGRCCATRDDMWLTLMALHLDAELQRCARCGARLTNERRAA